MKTMRSTRTQAPAMRPRAMRAAMMVAGLALASVALPAAAQCAGKLVDHRNIYLNPNAANKTKIGELQVYYHAASGKNCAVVKHGGPTWGVRMPTAVSIGVCRNASDRRCNHPDLDPNANPAKFDYEIYNGVEYAGPVKVSAPESCIRAAGYLYYKGAYRHAPTIYGHCGT